MASHTPDNVPREVIEAEGPSNPDDAPGRVVASSLADQTARNSLFGFLGLVYPVALSVIVTPILIHQLGVAQYGVFALATLMISFLVLLDFGLSPSLVKWLSDSLARGDRARVDEILGTGFFLYVVVGVAAGTLGLLAARFFPSSLFGIVGNLQNEARASIAVASCGLFFAMVASVFASVPVAAQRFAVTAWVRALTATLTAVGSIAAAYTTQSVVLVVLVNALAPVVAIAGYWLANRRLLPGFVPRARWDRSTARELLTFGGLAAVGGLSGFFLLYLDRILLGILANISAVTYYTIPSTLSQRLHAGATGLAGVIFPATSALVARGETERARTLYQRATLFVSLAVTSIAVPVACLAPQLLSYWIDPSFATHSATVLRLLLLAFFMLSLSVVPYYVIIGGGKPQFTAAGTLVAALLNVALLFALVPTYGVTGAGVAFVVSVVPILTFIPLAERRILGLTRTVWRSLGPRLLLLAIVQATVVLLLARVVNSLGTLILVLTVGVPILPIGAWASRLLAPDDVALLRRLIFAHRRVKAP